MHWHGHICNTPWHRHTHSQTQKQRDTHTHTYTERELASLYMSAPVICTGCGSRQRDTERDPQGWVGEPIMGLCEMKDDWDKEVLERGLPIYSLLSSPPSSLLPPSPLSLSGEADTRDKKGQKKERNEIDIWGILLSESQSNVDFPRMDSAGQTSSHSLTGGTITLCISRVV